MREERRDRERDGEKDSRETERRRTGRRRTGRRKEEEQEEEERTGRRTGKRKEEERADLHGNAAEFRNQIVPKEPGLKEGGRGFQRRDTQRYFVNEREQ